MSQRTTRLSVDENTRTVFKDSLFICRFPCHFDITTLPRQCLNDVARSFGLLLAEARSLTGGGAGSRRLK